MHKLVVLYPKPTDPAHFREYYVRTHLPLAAKMPDARAELIPNTGHLVFLEAPAKFDELMLGFLAK